MALVVGDGGGGGGLGSNLDICGAQAVPRHQRPGQREIRLAEEDAAASVDSEPWKPKSTFVHHKRGARAGDRGKQWAPGFSGSSAVAGTGAATAAANAAAARLQKLQQLRQRVGAAVKVNRPPILLRAPLLLFCFRPGNQACAVAAQGPHISQQAVLHCASAQAAPSGFRGAFPGPLGKPHAPAAHWASSGATASRPQSANSSAVAKSILDWNRQMHPLVKERECRKRCCRLLATGHALAQLEVLAQTDL